MALRVGDIWYTTHTAEDPDPSTLYECYKVVQVKGKATALLQSALWASSIEATTLDWTPFSPVKGIYKRASGRIKLVGHHGVHLVHFSPDPTANCAANTN